MKITLLLTALLFSLAFNASAQKQEKGQNFNDAPPFNLEEFNKHLGKIGVLCDTVRSMRIVNDTLTLLNMGGVYPHQKYTVAVRGNKITLDLTDIKGKVICVAGTFELYKNQPQIMVAEPAFIQVK